MKKINQELNMFAGYLSGKNSRIFLLVLTVALFILGAAAPNATIAIGK